MVTVVTVALSVSSSCETVMSELVMIVFPS